ncbi:MAG TPA: hypothetical protein PKZ00_11705, partial [Elusimicrobiota bacterium]|nr:hypothetical protein [Elusimicrobiota bacterium]
PRVRLGPLTNYTLSAGMNQSLRLAWNGSTCGCQLQKIETTARQLARAREALKALESPDNRR